MGTVPYQIENEKSLYQNWRQRNNRYSWWHARAERRYKEYISQGIQADYETIYQDIVARDYQDSHREISPLIQAKDAIRIDTSNLTIDEVVKEVLELVRKA